MAILDSLFDTIVSFKYPGGLLIERRESAGRDELGEDLPPTVSVFRADPIVIQPLEGADRLQNPEGDRDSEQVLTHSYQLLRVGRGGTDDMADVILYDPTGTGDVGRYVVRYAAPWRAQANAFVCKAVREESR